MYIKMRNHEIQGARVAGDPQLSRILLIAYVFHIFTSLVRGARILKFHSPYIRGGAKLEKNEEI